MHPSITVIVPAFNAAADLRHCLPALLAHSADRPDELIVVDDGSSDGTALVAREYGAVVLATAGGGQPLGPARARNLGASRASGTVLLFLDADVAAHPDTVARVRQAFAADASLDAVIGAYDDHPAHPSFLSQYKNLQHAFVHRQGGRRASATFWTGCGAVRRALFLEHRGFLETYSRPSIEDIEFGARLVRAGARLILDPAIQVQHRKQWTAFSLIRTDIFQRAVPWTELILREGAMPNDLNLATSHRLSAVAVWLSLGLLVAGYVGYAAAGVVLLPVLLNRHFYLFLTRRRGVLFALRAIPWQILYLAYSSATFALVALRHGLLRRRPPAL